jgi:iron complex transport system ATP-binding protein
VADASQGNNVTGEISIENVTVRADRKTLVHDVSLHISPAEMVALVGPNGAGKTTLLRTVYRAQRPTVGRVMIDGQDVWRTPTKRVARHLAAVLQDAAVDFELTVYDVVAMGRTPYKSAFEGDNADDREIIAEALSSLDIAELTDASFTRLSGGQKQRALIARALAQRTDAIVLDEPTNHLDLRHQHDTLHLLRRTGATVFAALHDLNLAAMYCDRICVLDAGDVVAIGAPADVLTVELLTEVYGVDVRIDHDPNTGVPHVAVLPRAAATP